MAPKNDTRLSFSKATNRKALGDQGEAAVAQYLIKNNYRILETNFRKKTGEIDIIAQHKHVIAFVEVKFRLADYFNLSEVITRPKQKKIISTAHKYILENKCVDTIFRFDVALVHYTDNDFAINYIRNAFTQ